MIRNPFNSLLRAEHDDQPPANNPGTAAPETAPEGEEEKEAEAEPEPAKPDEAPEAAAPKLTAFERGKLRLMGMGDLIARVEKAEGETFLAESEAIRLTAANKKLTSENIRLTSELKKLETETPKQLEAAAKAKENEVSRGVRAELTQLGVSEAEAPAQSAVAGGDGSQTKTRAEFDAMKPAARTKFILEGGKLTD
jgi:hypothetical protein